MLHGRDNPNLLDILFEHYIVCCVFFALFVLTLIGVGDVRTVSIAGFILCLAGVVQSSATVDLWIFVPFVLYNVMNMASSYAAHGNITEGYGGIQLILPTIYLLMGCMDASELCCLRRMCALWSGLLAAAGVIGYAAGAVFWDRAGRLSGALGNPNAMGIFMVMGWFAIQYGRPETNAAEQRLEESKTDPWTRILTGLEPVVLFAAALTMSMGSFAAMAAGIIALLASGYRRKMPGLFRYACRLLAKAAFGIGTGLLLYLGVVHTGVRWICIPLSFYALAVAWCWKDFECFLYTHTRMTAGIAAAGILVAGTAVAARSGSLSTFAERLEMMRSGLQYLTVHPLLGVGPFEWRLLDMQDGGKYFGTWHIHNVLIHAGVEFGWIAMAMLVCMAVRFYRKKTDARIKAGFTAFCFHNMMDTSFFYVGVTSFALIMAGNPGEKGKRIGNAGIKILFGLLAVVYAIHFYNISVMQAGGLP